jgi:hypothetical protein
MPSFRDAFPSRYLKASDLVHPTIGTIHSVQYESVGTGSKQESKLVARFKESSLKPLVLNTINASTIAEICDSDDTDDWPGHQIQLFAAKTEFQGKRVPCIRVEVPDVVKKRKPASPSVLENELEDDITF